MKKFILPLVILATAICLISCHSGSNPTDIQNINESMSAPSQPLPDTPTPDNRLTPDKDSLIPDNSLTPDKDSGLLSQSETAEVVNQNTEVNEKTSPAQPEQTAGPLVCSLSVTCRTILDNMDSLRDGKASLIPDNGIILSKTSVKFNEGETAFNVLQRELKREKIHLEHTSAPIYNSIYIEGINNIYEFDCGETSGWMYRVNNTFPNYSSGHYTVKSGDNIEFIYTCNLGKDIGGDYATDGQKKQ